MSLAFNEEVIYLQELLQRYVKNESLEMLDLGCDGVEFNGPMMSWTSVDPVWLYSNASEIGGAPLTCFTALIPAILNAMLEDVAQDARLINYNLGYVISHKSREAIDSNFDSRSCLDLLGWNKRAIYAILLCAAAIVDLGYETLHVEDLRVFVADER